MSNMGLELALKGSGLHMLRANVGDKYVLKKSAGRRHAGGEQSGHILSATETPTTGDGC